MSLSLHASRRLANHFNRRHDAAVHLAAAGVLCSSFRARLVPDRFIAASYRPAADGRKGAAWHLAKKRCAARGPDYLTKLTGMLGAAPAIVAALKP